MSESQCKGCPCQTWAPVTRREDVDPDIAVVFDRPTKMEASKDEWLKGPKGGAGDVLRAMIESLDIDSDLVYFTSATNCIPQSTSKKSLDKNAAIACGPRLRRELDALGPKYVLCLGPIAFAAVMELERLPAITKIRGKWHEDKEGRQVLPTLPPGFVLADTGYYRDLAFDIHKFFTTYGPDPEPEINVSVPGRMKSAQKELKRLVAMGKPIAVDLETYGFSPISNDVLAMGFGVLHDNKRDAEVVIFKERLCEMATLWKDIEKLLKREDVEFVFHNAKFDLQFIRSQLERHGHKYKPVGIHDTMMLHYALDERPMGKFGSHGLEGLARTRYDAPDYGIPMGEWLKTWAGTPEGPERNKMRKNLHAYLTLDVYYTARLFPDLWNECVEESDELLDLYDTLLMPGTLALADVEFRGMLIDVPMFEKSSVELNGAADKLLLEIRKTVGDDSFNPSSPAQVKKYVYDTLGLSYEEARERALGALSDRGVEAGFSRGTFTSGSQGGPTSSSVLRFLARGYPEHEKILIDVCEYRNLTKNAGTYVDGLLRRVDVDDRIRGSFNIHGTATGRLSSTNPNLQNIPPSSHTGIEIRSGFMAPPGFVLVEADYKQLEVRIAAELSGDPAMIELFEKGRDIHAEVSRAIYNRPPEEITSYMRMLGKIMLFGMLYGRSAKSVETGPEQEDIVMRGGERWNTEQVEEFFNNLLSEWPVYAEWRKKLQRDVYKNGEIVLPSGRRRRFDFISKFDGGKTGRAGLNTPVQGTASDFTLYSLIQLNERLPEPAGVISTVHDSLLIECLEDQADEVVALTTEIMEKDTLFPTKVPLKIDIDVTKRWDEDDKRYGDTKAQLEKAES